MEKQHKAYTNRLIHESSPYLLQHAHNPVDWYPYGPEAFEKAQAGNKPVLVSIGYAACHWCHVMERESFEDPEVAAFMNAHFINIKVDREERPDVDHIYMDALQAMEGSGGWPLNMFLTPDKKPFYGGTYFPPQRAFNRSSWKELLQAVATAYTNRREEIEQQAEALTQHLQQGIGAALKQEGGDTLFETERLQEALAKILEQADREWGGFGQAPKFPQTYILGFLLRYAHLYNHQGALDQATLSLDKMAMGGIYDQIGGGFARYSTDREWLVPHFEKMLYDNALLLGTYSEAYQLTGNDLYKDRIEQTISFLERELADPSGGFYSALDADSEGEEGRYYVWSYGEVKKVLKEEADLFCRFYDIRPEGNWEGKSILRVLEPEGVMAAREGLTEEELKTRLRSAREKLLAVRSHRVHPQLDDKVLLGWNALTVMSLCQAYAAVGEVRYLQLARKTMTFLEAHLQVGQQLYHTWKADQARIPAFLDDYAAMIAAQIELAQVSGELEWLRKAEDLTTYIEEHFSEEAGPLFYFTHQGQEDILLRKKEVYDGATPSGNALMARNLFRLSVLLDRPEWKERALAQLAEMGAAAIRYPASFGMWLSLLLEVVHGTREIAIIGKDAMALLQETLRFFIPHRLILAALEPDDTMPLLRGKQASRRTALFFCENYVCRQPVETVNALKALL